jgi:glycosyltransferase
VKITVVTAVFNREGTVGQAIDSVAGQSFRDIEHIVIDGASTDATLSRVHEKMHSRMRVVSESDEGIYDALNKGIALATGDVVGLMHSDDMFAHNRVLSLVADAFAASDVDAVYGDLDYVAADDPRRVIRHWRAGAFVPRLLGRGWMPPHPTMFLRRQIFERLGAYDTSYRIAADYDAVLRWLGPGKVRCAYIPEVLVKMRVGGESNRTLRKIVRKSVEDYRAIRTNGVGGIGTLILKNVSKLPQFVLRNG